mmetsp:Transcript_862/g.1232  ORF Transcript_862/g.1232 Transcript_862/m.1232 type:complete len:206 (-) Transcript_862:128-745(-)
MFVGVVKLDTLSDSFPCGIEVTETFLNSSLEGGLDCGKRIHAGTDVFPATFLFRGVFLACSDTTAPSADGLGVVVVFFCDLDGSSLSSILANASATANSAARLALAVVDDGGKLSPISPMSTFQRLSFLLSVFSSGASCPFSSGGFCLVASAVVDFSISVDILLFLCSDCTSSLGCFFFKVLLAALLGGAIALIGRPSFRRDSSK